MHDDVMQMMIMSIMSWMAGVPKNPVPKNPPTINSPMGSTQHQQDFIQSSNPFGLVVT